MTTYLRLKKGKELALRDRHPWIFSGAFSEIPKQLEDGSFVDVLSSDGGHVCSGHYQNDSIAVKVLSYSPINDEAAFIGRKLEEAYELRKSLGLVGAKETTAYRLVHGEGDGLPGLVIDIYNQTAVLQFHSAAMHRLAQGICNALRDLFGSELCGCYEKPVQEKGCDGMYIWGSGGKNVILENDLKFKVDWEKGQKTGFFLDQRENRKLLRSYASGRKALNAFCYTGGFSVAALAGGASHVTSIDSSQSALRILDENIALNFENAAHESLDADCLKYLKDMPDDFDLIVLDPPAFIKHRGALKGGIQGYKSINTNAMKHIKSPGILFTFSCSQLLSRDDFLALLKASALEAGKQVRVLHRMSQGDCHPVSIFHPEGEYLKGFVLGLE